jgi:hypothetical protein
VALVIGRWQKRECGLVPTPHNFLSEALQELHQCGVLLPVCEHLLHAWVDRRYRRLSGMPRMRLYKHGIVFSAILTALPGLWAVVAWFMTVITGHKLD